MADLLDTEVYAVDLLPVEYFSELDLARGPFPSEFFDTNPGAPPASPPVISALTPAAMTTVARNQVHQFDFTDDGPFRKILLAVGYPSGRWDFVYNGTTFLGAYTSSTIAPITGGYHLAISRTGGWAELGALQLFVAGFDQTGQENVP